MTDLRAIDDELRLAGPHQTRPIRFVRPERVGDWRLELYAISTHGWSTRRPRGAALGLR